MPKSSPQTPITSTNQPQKGGSIRTIPSQTPTGRYPSEKTDHRFQPSIEETTGSLSKVVGSTTSSMKSIPPFIHRLPQRHRNHALGSRGRTEGFSTQRHSNRIERGGGLRWEMGMMGDSFDRRPTRPWDSINPRRCPLLEFASLCTKGSDQGAVDGGGGMLGSRLVFWPQLMLKKTGEKEA
ncbi:hypothetical protein BT69DRAFT_1335556 [Atractiella rhizophila]|nr:hypothetical protein BT69DRAFT_1335556 [Atractiella rhizophila]